MRISQDEALSIRKAIQARDPSATVSLFGSMADDKAHGGDIDLLVRSNRLTLSDRLDIACELEDALGLRKIDLVMIMADRMPLCGLSSLERFDYEIRVF